MAAIIATRRPPECRRESLVTSTRGLCSGCVRSRNLPDPVATSPRAQRQTTLTVNVTPPSGMVAAAALNERAGSGCRRRRRRGSSSPVRRVAATDVAGPPARDGWIRSRGGASLDRDVSDCTNSAEMHAQPAHGAVRGLRVHLVRRPDHARYKVYRPRRRGSESMEGPESGTMARQRRVRWRARAVWRRGSPGELPDRNVSRTMWHGRFP